MGKNEEGTMNFHKYSGSFKTLQINKRTTL
jgi:hypothetical protein